MMVPPVFTLFCPSMAELPSKPHSGFQNKKYKTAYAASPMKQCKAAGCRQQFRAQKDSYNFCTDCFKKGMNKGFIKCKDGSSFKINFNKTPKATSPNRQALNAQVGDKDPTNQQAALTAQMDLYIY